MARIVWSREALAQLDLISDYIASVDPAAARRTAQRIFYAGKSLATFPNRGRLSIAPYRELVTALPYIIRYRVVDDEVRIVGIRHAARLPPGEDA